MNTLNKEAHALEEINGVKCAVAEKNVSKERSDFLKKFLEHNHYTVQVALMQPPKVAAKVVKPAVAKTTGDVSVVPVVPVVETPRPPLAPELFIVGVTDLLFHPMLAVYERSLKTFEGAVASIAYWNEEPQNENELYWMRRKK